jgi:fibronectin-binding autotransporter adhesin
VRVTGDNTFTGALTVSAGTFEVGGAGRLNLGSYSGAISNSGTFLYNSTANQTLSGAMSGAGSLVKANTSTLTLTGTSTTTNPAVVVSGGTLVLNGSRGFNEGYFTNQDTMTYSVASGATLDIRGSWNNRHNNGITLHGGTLHFSRAGEDNYANVITMDTAPATISAAVGFRSGYLSNPTTTVTAAASGSIITASVYTVYDGKTWTFNVADGAQNADLTISGVVRDLSGWEGMPLVKSGSGTLLLSGNNLYNGPTTINQGVLAVSGGNGIGDASSVTLSASDATATLRLDANESINSLAGGSATAGGVNLQGNTLQIGRQIGNATTTYDGVISGTGGLVRRGAGTTTLTGPSTFTGSVLVQDTGTIAVPSVDNIGVSQPLGAGATPIQLQGGTLSITGAGPHTTNRGLQLVSLSNESAVLSVAGTVNMSGEISGGSSGSTFTKAGSGTFNFSGTGSWSGNLNITGGAFELSGAGSIPSTGVTTLSAGASLRINTTGVMQTIRVTAAAGTSVNLEAGTLRVAGGDLGGSPVYSIDNTGSFTWGTGTTLGVYGGKTSGQTDRTSLAGAASGPAIKEGNYLYVKNDLTQPAGSTLDLGGLYGSSDALRYNQIHVTGALDHRRRGEPQAGSEPVLPPSVRGERTLHRRLGHPGAGLRDRGHQRGLRLREHTGHHLRPDRLDAAGGPDGQLFRSGRSGSGHLSDRIPDRRGGGLQLRAGGRGDPAALQGVGLGAGTGVGRPAGRGALLLRALRRRST